MTYTELEVKLLLRGQEKTHFHHAVQRPHLVAIEKMLHLKL